MAYFNTSKDFNVITQYHDKKERKIVKAKNNNLLITIVYNNKLSEEAIAKFNRIYNEVLLRCCPSRLNELEEEKLGGIC
jgi:hypothetical protein